MDSLTDTSDLAPVLDSNSIDLKPKVWSPKMTVFWTFSIFLVFALGQLSGTYLAAMANGLLADMTFASSSGDAGALESFIYANDLAWPAGLMGALIGSLMIVVVIRLLKGLPLKDYLNLGNVRWQTWTIWLLAFLGISIITGTLEANFEVFQTDFMGDVIGGSRSIPLLFLTVGILAPIFEELLFRGFVFKGLERSVLGGHGTVWLTALAFASIHLQYPIGVVALIVPTAVVLGYSRMYSGSLLVPIALHVANNSVALLLTLGTDSGTSFF